MRSLFIVLAVGLAGFAKAEVVTDPSRKADILIAAYEDLYNGVFECGNGFKMRRDWVSRSLTISTDAYSGATLYFSTGVASMAATRVQTNDSKQPVITLENFFRSNELNPAPITKAIEGDSIATLKITGTADNMSIAKIELLSVLFTRIRTGPINNPTYEVLPVDQLSKPVVCERK